MIEIEAADGRLFAASNQIDLLPLIAFAWCNTHLELGSFRYDLALEKWLFKKIEDAAWFEIVYG